MESIDIIKHTFAALSPFMDERMRRLWAAAEATALGRGGVTAGAAATGISRTTIARGMHEQQRTAQGEEPAPRLRHPGSGRKSGVVHAGPVLRDLEALVDPGTRGDPQSPLRWTCKSTRRLAGERTAMGHT